MESDARTAGLGRAVALALAVAATACTGTIDGAAADAASAADDADGLDDAASADADAPTFLDDDEMIGSYRALFTYPEPGETDYSIVVELARYIDGAAPGSTIHGHITTLSRQVVTDALIRAQERGVEIFTVQNGNPTPESERLAAALGDRHVVCGDAALEVTSCVSTLPGATHHLKDWMLSRTVVDGTEYQHVTWVTSQNLTVSTSRMFNDLLIVSDNQAFYDANRAAFDSFYRQERTDDLYNVPGRGHHVVASANAEISLAPQTTSPGHTEYHASNDHVARALSRINAYEPGCRLGVAALSVYRSRTAILDELLRIAELGCQVQIAYTDMNTAAFDRLDGNVELHRAESPAIHSKMMVYRGSYDGVPGRSMVWGGSHNFSMGSLRQRDEIFVAISRHALADRYFEYFDEVWARADATVEPNKP